jgi:hypothetical protein
MQKLVSSSYKPAPYRLADSSAMQRVFKTKNQLKTKLEEECCMAKDISISEIMKWPVLFKPVPIHYLS